MAGLDGPELLKATCEMLAGTQLSDGAQRKAAEQRLDEAASTSPNQLVHALASVLAATTDVPADIRQEAAVILRQLVIGNTTREPAWHNLEDQSRKGLMAQLLKTLEQDSANIVKRSCGQVAVAIATAEANTFDELQEAWPELLPGIWRLLSNVAETPRRVVALQMLKDLSPMFGDGIMERGEEVVSLINGTLSDAVPEVRAASAEFALTLVEMADPEAAKPLGQVMPAIINVIQGFTKESNEDQLKETLNALQAAVDEEPEFFKDNGIESLWPTLIELAAAGATAFSDPDIRHSAMEAALSLALGLSDDFSKPDGQAQLERLIGLNIEWMLEIEEDVEAWTNTGKDANEDDDVDDDVVGIAEANMDRLGEKLDEDVLMPMLNKLILNARQDPSSTWKHSRACIMSISQVVEYIEDDSWVDQCVNFLLQHSENAHPRVRHATFNAIGQIAYDHTPHVQEAHHAALLPAIIKGIEDPNIRVATSAVDAFTSIGDELDDEDLKEHVDDLLRAIFARLFTGQVRAMQVACLSAIAAVAEVLEDQFEPYYSTVLPMLKQILVNASDDKEKSLRGKALECVGVVGSAVSKETFAKDAHEVMQLMIPMLKTGFVAEDEQRESVRCATEKIARALGKDFKTYVPALLPVLFGVLSQRPKEVDPSEMPDEDDDEEEPDWATTVEGGKIVGLKTAVIAEMKECLELIDTFLEALEEDFCEFMAATCQNLLPLVQFQLSEELRAQAFSTWEALSKCARAGVERGRIDKSVLQELVKGFLETTVSAISAAAESDESMFDDEPDMNVIALFQARALGISGVIRNAGEGVLNREAVQNMANVIMQLMTRLKSDKDEKADPSARRSRGAPVNEEDEDEDEAEETITKQSVRFALADIVSALMATNASDFCEVALQPVMQMVQAFLGPDASESDRSLGFYITDDVVECLGERSVPYWQGFMNAALQGVTDKSAMVRQYAANTIGNGAKLPPLAVMAKAAASQIGNVVQKQRERHRRRRAVKTDDKQTAIAVDAGIRALGDICEHHEQQLGEHAVVVWKTWLSSLPLKYDQDGGHKAHAQLMRLLARRHPLITAPDQQEQVVAVLTEVYNTRYSTKAIDKDIRAAMSQIGEATLKPLCGSNEKRLKRVERILKDAAKPES